jgi:F0F1-type ATP synthase membrane subunit a
MLFPDKSTIILFVYISNGAMFLGFAGMIWVLALDRVSRDADTGQIILDLDFSCLVTRLSIF